MFILPKEPLNRQPDAAEPTEEQKRKLSELMYGAFVEIRTLELDGKHEQARAVADLFLNLPMLMWTSWFSFNAFRLRVASYHKQFAGSGHVNFTEWLTKIASQPQSEGNTTVGV